MTRIAYLHEVLETRSDEAEAIAPSVDDVFRRARRLRRARSLITWVVVVAVAIGTLAVLGAVYL